MKKIQTDIVILGVGIGGYEAFRTLSALLKKNKINKKILLVDQNSFFTFTPLLHEVASGDVNPTHATISIRELIYKTDHSFLKARVKKILPNKKQIITDNGVVNYDQCITSLGSGVNYFGTPGAKQYTYNVKTAKEALSLKKNFFALLDKPKKEINLVVVGGGFTGVEVAMQFCDFIKKEAKLIYKEKHLSITIIESGNKLTKFLPEKARNIITDHAKEMGITVITNTRVSKVEKSSVTLNNGKQIKSDITIWSTGCKNIAKELLTNKWLDKDRIPVNKYLQHKNEKSFYAIGDIALSYSGKDGACAPQLGEVAYHQGNYVAHHIINSIKNKKTKPFKFISRGTLIPIGEWHGIAIFNNIVISGKIAWWLRRTAYLLFLPGIMRKLQIVSDWSLRSIGFRPVINHD